MSDHDDLKQRFEEEGSRVDVPPLDAVRLARRAARRRTLRTSIRVSALGVAVIGVLSVSTLIRKDGGQVELVQPATAPSLGAPPAGSLAPGPASSLAANPQLAPPRTGARAPEPERRSDPTISADGRFVAYAAGEIFVFDRTTRTREVVSFDEGGRRINGSKPQVSADGRLVAFVSPSGVVYLRDRAARQTLPVSVSTTGEAINAAMREPSISMTPDGKYVAFTAAKSTLVADDANAVEDVFVRDIGERITTLVSVSSSGEPSNGRSAYPDISSDGRYVTFMSYATNLHTGSHPECPAGVCPQVYVHDRQVGQTHLVSVASGGEIADRGGRHPTISGDGRFVAFDSASGSLGSIRPDGGAHDIFLHNRDSGETRELSGAHESCNCTFPYVSDDGGMVAYGAFSLGLWIRDGDASPRKVASYGGGTIGFSGAGTLVVYRSAEGDIVVLDRSDGRKMVVR